MGDDGDVPKAAGGKRTYSQRTLKILFARCGNRCAEPSCTNPLIKPQTDESLDLVVGQIAHIYAVADLGPRGKPCLSIEERNSPNNLILLCPTHHAIVDGQHQDYPASLLLEWKERQERPFREQLSRDIKDIGYVELEFAAKSLMSSALPIPGSLAIIPPETKLR